MQILIARSFRTMDRPVRYFGYEPDTLALSELPELEVRTVTVRERGGQAKQLPRQNGCLLRFRTVLGFREQLVVFAIGEQLILEVAGHRFDLISEEATLGMRRVGPICRLSISYKDRRPPQQFTVVIPLLQFLAHDPATDLLFAHQAAHTFAALADARNREEWRDKWNAGVDPTLDI